MTEEEYARRYEQRRQEERRREEAMWRQQYEAQINGLYTGEGMATVTTSGSTSSRPSTTFTATPESPILCSPLFRGPLTVVIVGAGGTGARIVPPLVQMLRRGDSVAIVDHDIVEDRNLVRQHFVMRDIGQHKAAVLAGRYNRPDRIDVRAYTARLVEGPNNVRNVMIGDILTNAAGRRGDVASRGVVFLGCVDNAAARRAIRAAAMHAPGNFCSAVAYIDVGNEMRGGQVLMTLANWSMKVMAGGNTVEGGWKLPAMEIGMPQLLKDAEQDAVSCGERMDLQTVQVNHLSAATALNCLSWLILGIPFSTCGCFFSTLNTMQPIQIEKVDWSARNLTPTEAYANNT